MRIQIRPTRWIQERVDAPTMLPRDARQAPCHLDNPVLALLADLTHRALVDTVRVGVGVAVPVAVDDRGRGHVLAVSLGLVSGGMGAFCSAGSAMAVVA